MPSRSAIVRVGLGLLLVAAAGLKLYGLGVSAVPQVGWFAQPWVQLAVAEWELVLGLWLISGAAARFSWLAALITFAAFAAVSGYLGSIGVASCGCFGTIQASPWWAFGVDAVALILLSVAVPTSEPSCCSGSGLSWIVVGTGITAALLILGSAVFHGSIEVGLARLRGEPLAVEPSYVAFPATAPGSTVKRHIRIHNLTSGEVHLIGGTSDCSCVVTSGLPVVIAPKGFVDIPIRLSVPGSAEGQFTRRVEIWTNLGELTVIRLLLGCHVTPEAEGR